MVDIGPVTIPLPPAVEHVIQWAIQSPEHLVVLIVGGIAALVVSVYVLVTLIRWGTRTCFRLTVWLGATAWDVAADRVHRLRPRRWLPPGQSDTTQSTDSTRPTPTELTREYLRIRPTSAEYDPETLVMALEDLHETHHASEIRLPVLGGDRADYEVLAATTGAAEGVEFYVGGSVDIDHLARLLPYRKCGFDVDRVTTHPARLLDPRISDAPGVDTPALPAAGSPGDSPATHPETAADGGATTLDGTPPPPTDDAPGHAPSPTAGLLDHLVDCGREPVVYRYNTTGARGNDWMLRLPGLTELFGPRGEDGSRPGQTTTHPLTAIVETLDDLPAPCVYQVTWRSFRTWRTQADRRERRLEKRRDTLGQRIAHAIDQLLEELEGPPPRERGHTTSHRTRHTRDDRHGGHTRSTQRYRPPPANHSRSTRRSSDREIPLSREEQDRLEEIAVAEPSTSAVANVRVAAVPTAEGSRDEIARTLRGLWQTIEHRDGKYYQLAAPPGERTDRLTGLLGVRGARHRQRLRRLCNRTVKTPVLGHTRFNPRRWWPDLVCTYDELAVWTAIPSTSSLPESVTDHLTHRPAHTDAQQTLTPALRQSYVAPGPGVTIATLLADDRQADPTKPVSLQGRDLYRHVLTLGMTGVGKTTDQAQRAAAAATSTDGPTIILTGPGANVGRYTMRALAADEGCEWLEEHVHWFPFPAVMPGLTVLDVEDMAARHPDLVDRWDAVEQVRDYLLGVLRQVLGFEYFDRAPRSVQLIQELVMLAFDPEHWYDNTADPRRRSPDRCRFSHLTTALAELAAAGPPNGNRRRRPRSSRPDYDRSLAELLEADPETFHNVINGAHTRLNAIANYDQRLMLFDNTESRCSFSELLDSDDVFIFDLSTLEPDAQQLMTLLLVIQLYDALQANRGDLQGRPEDYMVNLVVDEAAHLVGFEYLSTLLAQGRNHRLAMDLATQFAEQVEEQADREAFLNLLNNTGTKLLATHNLDDDVAKHLQPEGMTEAEVRQQVRDLPEAHRLLLLPPQPDAERPQALTVHRGDLPRWHPDADATPFEEATFEATLEAIRERTAAAYGLPDEVREGVRSGWDRPSLPAEVQHALGLERDTDVDGALALMAAHVQSERGLREVNGWVAGPAVTERLDAWLEHAAPADGEDTDAQDDTLVRDAQGLLEAATDSPYLECAPAAAVAEVPRDEGIVVCLTDPGEEVVAELESSGTAGAAGGDAHDELLDRAAATLIRAGFEVTVVEQVGQSAPDARAIHPDVEWPLFVEVERTTRHRPHKVLQNLARAQDQGAVPLFVLEAGEDEATALDPAAKVGGILDEPVNTVREVDGGTETVFYNHTNEQLTFDGGASAGGATAVRPTTGADDARRSVWVRTQSGAYVLRDRVASTDTEYIRVSDYDAISRTDVPAYVTHNPKTGERTVHESGDTYTYETTAAFQDDWVAIKEPFVPARKLPVPEYDRDTYAICIVTRESALPGSDGGTAGGIHLYEDGDVQPIDNLVEALAAGDVRPAAELQPETAGEDDVADAESAPSGTTPDPDRSDLNPTQAGVASFAAYLDGPSPDEVDTIEFSEHSSGLRSDHVFAVYRAVADVQGNPVYGRRSHLSRELGKYVGYVSRQERTGPTSAERCTRWVGLQWKTESVRTLAEEIRSTEDEDRLEDLVEQLDASVKLDDAS